MAEQPTNGWAGMEYAPTAADQRAIDEWFLARHRPQPSDTVVDLGCGSGEFSVTLTALVPDGRVVGVDQDAAMLEVARSHGVPDLEFLQASATEFDRFLPAGFADLVVSRAMLHWLPVMDYPSVFAAVRRVLRPGGWFHSESAAAGHIPKLFPIFTRIARAHGLFEPMPFPDAGTAFNLVEAAGFEIPPDGVRTVAQKRKFTREQLAEMLRSTARVAITRHAFDIAANELTDELVSAVDELRHDDGSYDQTFVRLDILARRRVGD